ncbi:unnamed protein product [Symbiodinium natans]|uniref:Uncharacterized protein n=1 Tax=Symbiodinium natans TaxID=878477 RepID=A0A812K0I2_9DINO|nr:unnamed protein product [Symbiodinium natans]
MAEADPWAAGGDPWVQPAREAADLGEDGPPPLEPMPDASGKEQLRQPDVLQSDEPVAGMPVPTFASSRPNPSGADSWGEAAGGEDWRRRRQPREEGSEDTEPSNHSGSDVRSGPFSRHASWGSGGTTQPSWRGWDEWRAWDSGSWRRSDWRRGDGGGWYNWRDVEARGGEPTSRPTTTAAGAARTSSPTTSAAGADAAARTSMPSTTAAEQRPDPRTTASWRPSTGANSEIRKPNNTAGTTSSPGALATNMDEKAPGGARVPGPSERLIIPTFAGSGENGELGVSARSYL